MTEASSLKLILYSDDNIIHLLSKTDIDNINWYWYYFTDTYDFLNIAVICNPSSILKLKSQASARFPEQRSRGKIALTKWIISTFSSDLILFMKVFEMSWIKIE